MLAKRLFTSGVCAVAATVACALLSGCATLDAMLSQEAKECISKGGEMEPTKGFYVWREPDDIRHIYDYECSVK